MFFEGFVIAVKGIIIAVVVIAVGLWIAIKYQPSPPANQKIVEQIDAGFEAKTSKSWKVIDIKIIPWESLFYYQYFLNEENGKERFSVLSERYSGSNPITLPTIVVGDCVKLKRNGTSSDPNSESAYKIEHIIE